MATIKTSEANRPSSPPLFWRCGHDHRRRPARHDRFRGRTSRETRQLPAIKPGTNTSFAPLKQIDAGLLNVGYAEAGPADGPAVILLHGWPYDIHSFVDVAPLLASAGYRVIVPYLRGYGTTRFLSGDTVRNGQQSVVAVDIIALMDALKIEKATIAGFDWGARTANIIAALWPERCKAMVSVSGYLIGSQEAGKMPLPPEAELQWWYQYYFATERGRAGYDKYRHDFAKLIWQLASPKWNFDDATFDRTRGVLRQSGSRRHRDPQLSLAARPGRRRAEIRRSGKAACRKLRSSPCPPSPSKATPMARRTRTPSSYRQEILRQICAPDHHGRHRAQSASGSPAGLCRSRRRRRRSLIGAWPVERRPMGPSSRANGRRAAISGREISVISIACGAFSGANSPPAEAGWRPGAARGADSGGRARLPCGRFVRIGI